MSEALSPIWLLFEQSFSQKKKKTNTYQLVSNSIDLSCLPLFVIEEQPSRPVLFQITSFENCTECKILFKLAGLFGHGHGHGHAIKEPLIDNNFMKIFCNFMVTATDEYLMMSHCQGNTEMGVLRQLQGAVVLAY